MEPTEINGGRFYARPIHTDNRIDDRPALAKLPFAVDTERAQNWDDDYFAWAICEQTSVEMIAFAECAHASGGNPGGSKPELRITPIGDPNRVLPNDPVLPPKTPQDAADEIRGTLTRWCKAHGVQLSDTAD